LEAYSGIVCLDIDKVPPGELEAERERLMRDPRTYALFTSPSGHGLKVLVRVTSGAEEHERVYANLRQEVGGQYADAGTKDVSRACFLSWDPELYVNEDAEVHCLPEPTLDDLLGDLPRAERAAIIREARMANGEIPTDGTVNVNALLQRLLDEVERVDFRALARITGDSPPSRVHYRIHSVEQVMRVALERGYSLCRNGGFAYFYTGSHWQELDLSELQQFLGQAAERLGVDFNAARDYLFREQLLKQFLSVAHLTAPAPELHVTMVNLRNGTFEIRGKEQRLRPFDPGDFLRYQLPFDYDPDATAPMFRQFLDRVLPDKSLQDVIAEYMGYVFTKGLTLDQVLFLYGSGANGKSVLMNVLKAMFGTSNVTGYSIAELTEANGYNRANIANKLLNWGGEINGRTMNGDIFKSLASQEEVSACQKYKDPIMMRHYAKLAFNANELPREIEATEGFYRRFLVVPFLVTIPQEERDAHLAERIIAGELSGVFNWVLEGLQRLLNSGPPVAFTRSLAVEQAMAEYRLTSDSVRAFLAEQSLRPSLTNWRIAQDLYEKYRTYCYSAGNKSVSRGRFYGRLRGLGYELTKTKVGLVLHCEEHPDQTNEEVLIF
jgi:putative DNA primase/helicase